MSSPTAQASLAEMSVTAPIVGSVTWPRHRHDRPGGAVEVQCLGRRAPVVVLTVLPTTQMSVAELAEMDWPPLGVKSGVGHGHELHAEPFQCSRTALSPLADGPGVARGSARPPRSVPRPSLSRPREFTDQAVRSSAPSPCRHSRRPSRLNPTAQASVAVLALTAAAGAELHPGCALATSDHALPFQWSRRRRRAWPAALELLRRPPRRRCSPSRRPQQDGVVPGLRDRHHRPAGRADAARADQD